MIYFYRFIWFILSPIIIFWFAWRLIKGKEDKARFKERLGFSSIKRPKGKLIWFHGSSVGETLSILPLINELLTRDKKLNILVTSGTKTSAKLMSEKLPLRAFHQYLPLDYYFAVKKFINYWQADLSIFVESEFWPELIYQASNKILINARMSDRSFNKYAKHKWFINQLLSGFKLCLAQSKQDAERLKKLAIKNVEMSGNLKFDAVPSNIDKNELDNLLSILKNRPILVCASTHNKEEEMLAKVHTKLKQNIPDLLTIIVPRHPHRGENIYQQIKNIAETKLRSKGENITNTTNFYIADTIGEMSLWYSLAQKNGVVFMGGSLIPHGGQNPLEALKANCPVVCGANMQNFKNMLDDLLTDNAITQITNIEELETTIQNILSDKTKRDSLIKPIGCALEKLTGATKYTADKIEGLLNAKS